MEKDAFQARYDSFKTSAPSEQRDQARAEADKARARTEELETTIIQKYHLVTDHDGPTD